MSLAAETRAAARAHPWLVTALRADIINYRAAASFLDLEGDIDSVARALRRFGDSLNNFTTVGESDIPIRMHHGVDIVSDTHDMVQNQGEASVDILLRLNNEFIITADGQLSAIIVDTVPDMTISGFTTAIERIQMEDINIKAAGTLQDMFIVIVPRRKGASALRSVEAALTVIPTS